MLEEVWPEIGNAWVSGVLAGGGAILVQWLMPQAAKLLKRLRADKLRLERRLAAILAADVVGYSRLMRGRGRHPPSALGLSPRGHRAKGPRAPRPDRQTHRRR